MSVVIPVYNEETNLEALCAELFGVLDGQPHRFEVVLVDDGSTDWTFDLATRLAQSEPRLKVLGLARNFGQTAALQAGFDAARGRIVVVMDGDLQNDPADIPRMIAAVDEGYDVVAGWRYHRKDALLSRVFPSYMANLLLRTMTGVRIHDSGCALKAYRRQLRSGASLYSDMHRFLPILMAVHGASYTEIKVNHRPRERGVSKYGLSRIWAVVLDVMSLTMLSRFVSRPASWFLLLGAPFFLLALLGVAGLVADLGSSEPTPILSTAVVMLSSFALLHMLLLALVSELVVQTGEFRETAQPPQSLLALSASSRAAAVRNRPGSDHTADGES